MREDKRGYLVPVVKGVEPKDAIRHLIENTRLSSIKEPLTTTEMS
jgi:hypothetical protein